MAAYIPVPRDLSRVKSKILFNLTKRQLICFLLAALIGVPSFFVLRKLGSISMAAMGMIILMMPFFLLAMYERDGQPMEVIAKHFIETVFIRPRVRPYRTDNYYAILHRQAMAEKEVERIVQNSRKARKAGRADAGRSHKERAAAGPAGHRAGKEK